MAKTTGALLSLDAAGSFAKTIVVSRWKGRQYVRLRVTPSNPQTAGQQAVRAKLGAAGRFNSFVEVGSSADLAYNAASPADQSGASYFAKLQISNYDASKTAYELVGNATVKGYFDTAATTLGLTTVTIPGSTPVVVPAGLILWNAYQSSYVVSPTVAPTTAVSASAANITTFLGNISV